MDVKREVSFSQIIKCAPRKRNDLFRLRNGSPLEHRNATFSRETAAYISNRSNYIITVTCRLSYRDFFYIFPLRSTCATRSFVRSQSEPIGPVVLPSPPSTPLPFPPPILPPMWTEGGVSLFPFCDGERTRQLNEINPTAAYSASSVDDIVRRGRAI